MSTFSYYWLRVRVYAYLLLGDVGLSLMLFRNLRRAYWKGF